MPLTILLVRPAFSVESCEGLFELQSYSLALLLKKEGIKQRHRFVELSGCDATKEELEISLALHPEIDIVAFLGYGDSRGDRALGYRMEPCINSSNIHLLKDKGLYFVCCHAAKLGRKAVDIGANYFIGFNNEVWLMSNKAEWTIAHCVLSGLTELLREASPVEAFKTMQAEHLYWIEILRQKRPRPDPHWVVGIAVLKLNLEAATLVLPHERMVNVEKSNNPSARTRLNSKDIEKVIEILNEWVEDPKTRPDKAIAIPGLNDDVSLRKILKQLEDRRETGKWGNAVLAREVAEEILSQLG